jgi:unsaturated chondroitin disaccharide hydrolase
MSGTITDSAVSTGTFRTLGIDEALDFAGSQVRALIARAPGGTAAYTDDGRWLLDQDSWAPQWSGGFLAGQMWAQAVRSEEPWWREQAERYTLALESRKDDTSTHDLGFVLEPSFGRWYDVEPTDHVRDVLTVGGRTMARRLQRAGGYLCTWVDPGSTFIDVMMNVGIIFRAARLSGDEALAEVAMTHCRTSRRYLVRGDGSTVHEGWFDTTSGEFLHAATHQGFRSDSCWARGQAWAIYGFGTAFGYSGDADMLRTARAAADFYMAHTGVAGVPPNDWDDPHPVRPYESSAAAIASAGMQRLADHVAAAGDPAAERYRDYALRILERLRSTEFIAADEPGWEGVLRHGTYHGRNGLGVDESVMWGDYYFVEALELAARQDAAGEPE